MGSYSRNVVGETHLVVRVGGHLAVGEGGCDFCADDVGKAGW